MRSGIWCVFSTTFFFGSTLYNVDGQQINSLLYFYNYHCLYFLAMFMLLLLAFLGISKDYHNIRK